MTDSQLVKEWEEEYFRVSRLQRDEIERLQGACRSYELQANRDALVLERLRALLRAARDSGMLWPGLVARINDALGEKP